ncbi:MAG: NAD(P)/FAD-dependent oxidoreductase, partial [Rhodospirillaceae bacterium]
AAKKAGAVLAQSQEVVGLLGDGKSHVEGVRLSDGHTITADMTVCAAGPWSALVGQWVGLGLPLAPVRSHYWISAMDDRFARNQVMVFIPDGKFYSRPELGGLLYGFRDRVCVAADPRLYPPDPAGFAFGYDDEGWDSLAEGIAGFTDYFPGLDQVPTAHYISAASAYTPDGKFVIGAWPTVKGFLAVTGCSGAGIATSGGVGRAAAAMAAGSTAPYDMSLFRPDRFGPIDPVDPAFLQRCADARANKRAG